MQFTHEMYSNTRSLGNTITLYQRDGGEIILGGYVSSDKHRSLVADITPAPGQGESHLFYSKLIR